MSRWTLLQVGLLGFGLTALPLSAQDNPWRTNAAVEAAPMPRAKHGSLQVELRFDLKREAPARTPILPPIRAGFPTPICDDPPSDEEIIRALPSAPRSVPNVYQIHRGEVVIVKNCIRDRIDPPRMFPLVGAAQLHHCHWECAVHFRETIQIEVPFPMKSSKQRVEVVYVDKDFLHMAASEVKETRAEKTSDCGPAPARLAGTWIREMPGMVAAMSYKSDELTLTVKRICDGTIATATMTAEYAVTKDGTVHGVFTGADVDVKGNTDKLGLEFAQMSFEMQAMIDQPFAFRCRPTEGGVMVSNLRFPDPRREMTEELALLCGKYTFT